VDEQSEREMAVLQQVIVAARTIRAEYDLPPSKPMTLTLETDTEQALLNAQREAITFLCRASFDVAGRVTLEQPADTAMKVVSGVSVLVPLTGLIDPAKERERVERELKKTEKDLLATQKKLSNAGFVDRAPKEVVDQERARVIELQAAFDRLTAARERLATN
jgi:valyl-tRNA synthetase